MSVKQLYTVCILLCAMAVATQAQGILTGKVTDEETGEPLRGATVAIVGIKKGAFTDTKGMFRIASVPEGTYSVKITYVGYDAKTINGVTIVKGETQTLNTILGVTKSVADVVLVQAERVDDNAAALLAQRKNAAQVSDGIGREEISKLPDADAGQALKRVSGVTLVDGKYVYVRGVSDRYSNTTLNGAALTSTEPDKKSFAFDMFPAELLENANVVKTFTPDLPGNFAGGLVQLNTIDFPSARTFKVSGSQGFNDYVTFKKDGMLNVAGGSRDWLGMDDGSRALPAELPADRQGMNQLLRDVRAGNAAAITRMDNIGRSFNNRNWQSSEATATPNGGMSMTYTDIFDLSDNDQIGVVTSVNYGTSFQNNAMVRAGILSNPRDYLFQLNGFQSSRTVSWGGLANLAYRIGQSSTISFKNAFNRSADFDNVYLSGENLAQGVRQRLFSFQYVEKQLYTGTLAGEHSIAGWNNALVDWRAGYSTSSRYEPDFRRLQFLRNASDVGMPLYAAFDLTQQGAGSRAGRFYSDLDDEAFSGAVNVTVPVSSAVKVKFGGLAEMRTRTFKARSLTIVQGMENDVSDLFTVADNDAIPDLSPMFADSNYSVEKGRLSYAEDSKLCDTYDATERLGAAYAMADIPFSIAGLEMRVITGVRLEQSLQRLNSYTVTDDPVQVNQDLLDVLPTLNLVVKPSDQMNIRVSGSQTLARPSLREFAPFQFFDFQQQATIAGNPNLRRTLVQNFDVRYEYFSGPGEVMSASVFYKRFGNAIEETLFPQQSEIVRSFANAAGAAHNYGLEVEIRKSLRFISSSLSDFVISFNGALINSEITVEQAGVRDTRSMWGQSPYTVNMSLFYANPNTGTAVTLGYNTYGRRIIQVNQVGTFEGNPHVYELPRHVIDLSVVQPVLDNLELKVVIRDLLNQALRWEQEGALIQSNIRGMGVSLGFGYRIQR